ncbi:MAG: hypothetical protein COC17_01055 [Hyphomicrobiales bacterium]|nr:hypothetical protein [Hyphomicrobiales bacterium]PCH51757.1 MAG: hypothetical protein COC17_01055 [Hyphomicrobiales bacterium]
MNLKSITTTSFLGCALALLLLPSQASAQAMSPMRGQVKSFADSFALKVFPANPYTHRIRIEVKVYDQDFNPVKAQVSPAKFTLGGRFSRPVNVIVPFNGKKFRKVRVCTESIPFPSQKKTTTIKAQVCGKFLGERVN